MALTNSVSASTGVEINKWTIGAQFVINSRGAENLPAALLPLSRRHMSRTLAIDFFPEDSHRDIYFDFAGDSVEATLSAGSAAADISAEPLTPKRPTCLLANSLTTKTAFDKVVALTGLGVSSGADRVLKIVQDANTHTLMNLAQLFNIVPGDDADVYENAILRQLLRYFL